MDKLPKCRICLVENVRMYIVAGQNMHELYESLTKIPFITEDSRPMLACFFCYAKLKQCYQLQQKCLEAEELFAQMFNEQNPVKIIEQDQLLSFNGFVKTPVQNISIDGVDPIESIIIKQEPPEFCEIQVESIEPKQEHQSNDLKLENVTNDYSSKEDTLHHCESDLLVEFKIKVEEEQEVLEKKRRSGDTRNLELENVTNGNTAKKDTLHHCESDLLVEFKIEVEEEQEVLGKKRRASETRSVTAAQKPKEDTRRIKRKDGITEEQKKNEKADTKVIQTTKNSTRKIIIKEPHKCDVCQRSFGDKTDLKKHIRTHTVFKRGKTNAEMCKDYYYRKKAAMEAEKIRQGLSVQKPLKKTSAERSRAYRLRKKMLSQVNESSVTEILSIPSSNSRITTSEPSFQLATTSASTNRPDVSTVPSTGIADNDSDNLHDSFLSTSTHDNPNFILVPAKVFNLLEEQHQQLM